MAGAPREHDDPPSVPHAATPAGSEFYRRARDAHAAYFEDLVARCAEGYYSGQEARWMQRMRLDRQNIRLAVIHLLRPDPALAADSRRAYRARGRRMVIAYAASRAAIHQGDLGPMRALLHMALTDETVTDGTGRSDVLDPDVLDVVALALEAWIAAIQGDPGEARRLLTRAQTVFTGLVEAGACRAEDPPWALPYAQATSLWLTRTDPRDIQLAFALYEQAERLARRGSAGDAYMVLLFHAMAAAFHSDQASTVAASSVDAAMALAHRVRTEAAQSGAAWAISWSLWVSGMVELRHGDPRRALTLAQQALAGQEAIGDMWGPAWSLWLIALCLVRIHEYHRAAAVFGCAAAAQQRTQGDINGLPTFLALQRTEQIAARNGFATTGHSRDEFDELVSYWRVVALDARTSDTARIRHLAHDPPPTTTPPEGLTARQAEVARLRAAGRTRKEIAQELGVAVTTLDNHLAEIKNRTGASTPADLDAWLRAAETTTLRPHRTRPQVSPRPEPDRHLSHPRNELENVLRSEGTPRRRSATPVAGAVGGALGFLLVFVSGVVRVPPDDGTAPDAWVSWLATDTGAQAVILTVLAGLGLGSLFLAGSAAQPTPWVERPTALAADFAGRRYARRHPRSFGHRPAGC